jgi:hypothetical protein
MWIIHNRKLKKYEIDFILFSSFLGGKIISLYTLLMTIGVINISGGTCGKY